MKLKPGKLYRTQQSILYGHHVEYEVPWDTIILFIETQEIPDRHFKTYWFLNPKGEIIPLTTVEEYLWRWVEEIEQ